jgi:hypothetical protein
MNAMTILAISTRLEQVTEAEFFAALKADKRDVMPSAMGQNNEGRLASEWRTNDGRRVLFGATDTDGNSDNRYWLVVGTETA